MHDTRVEEQKIAIDAESIREFYSERAKTKLDIDVDAPVVLAGDQAPEKIAYWTQYEIVHRLPLAKIGADSHVLEVGFGTGRIAKYIIPQAALYLGIDCVEAFVQLAQARKDIARRENAYFLQGTLQAFAKGAMQLPVEKARFNRFIISGGVLMYINEQEVQTALENLPRWLDDACLLYISEPIALQKRLTLNKFYSDALRTHYSAIYRTESEYQQLFQPFLASGFRISRSEPFFQEDIKGQKETRQWLFVLER